MTGHRFNRRAPLIILFLLVALGLLLGGAYQSDTDQAAAAPLLPFDPTPWLPIDPPFDFDFTKFLIASDFSPAKDETEVALNKNITVHFNRDLDPTTINDNTEFNIRRSGFLLKLPAALSYSQLLDTATLNPSSNLLPDTVYEVTITNKITSEDGKTLFNPQTWSFKTISPPHVASKSPAANATGVPVDQSVSVTFDKTMDWSTVTAASFYLQELGGSVFSTNIMESVDKKTATLTHLAALKEGATYVVTLTTAVKAENGLSLPSTVTWMFQTVANAPTVIARAPGDGATNVPLDQSITATFDRDMDAATLTTATFYIQKSGGSPLVGTVNYSAATRTATLDPLADLEEAATYEVRLTTAVEAANGAPLAATVVWSFTTAGDAPTVTTKVPANGATGVPVGQTIAATFDKNMNPATLTSATFYVKKSGGSPLVGAVTYSAGTRTASLDPAADLEAGATYEVALTTSVQGENGLSLAAAVTWTFTTAESGGPGPGPTFPDVSGSPYEDAIYELASRGIISGYTDGTFGPNNLVQRRHFAKMIVGTMGLPVSESDWQDAARPFTDCGPDDLTDLYHHDYIAVAKANGLTQGKTPTTFAPYDTITHQQLITMVVRATGLADMPVGYTPPFTAAQFSLTEHYENAVKASAAGLLDGLVGIGPAYNFLAGSTRGECAQMLYNLIELLGS
ncbi:MAG: Ig-like domain-containing protein [Thermoleophilia bacterium]|nr:Ig-like domain-containing protein [Thermoleophilia bacterium]